MEFLPTALEDVILIEPDVYEDRRGLKQFFVDQKDEES